MALQADFPTTPSLDPLQLVQPKVVLVISFPPHFAGSAEKIEVVPGWIVVVVVRTMSFHFIIANMHLVPGMKPWQVRGQLRSLHRCLRRFRELPVILGGDLNFVDPDEGRMNVADGRLTFRAEPYYEAFHSVFHMFCEVAQPDHTRRRVENGVVVSLSRAWTASSRISRAPTCLIWTSNALPCGMLFSSEADRTTCL